MPRNVRNFWIDAKIDGQKSTLSGGPKNKEGGFSMVIKQRDNGTIIKAFTVDGWVKKDGTLKLAIGSAKARIDSRTQGNIVISLETTR
jgi:hypothetical protein